MLGGYKMIIDFNRLWQISAIMRMIDQTVEQYPNFVSDLISVCTGPHSICDALKAEGYWIETGDSE
jgi:hypothetical protein